MADFSLAQAVAQGVITASGVVIGVSLTELSVRTRERRRRLEQQALVLAWELPRLLVVATGSPGMNDVAWTRLREAVGQLLLDMRAEARWPLRRHRELRDSLEDMLARIGALEVRREQGIELRKRELVEFSHRDILRLVFGRDTDTDSATAYYAREGFASPYTGREVDLRERSGGQRSDTD